MTNTRSGEQVSAQIGRMGEITNLAQQNFSLNDGQVFNIKNDGVSLTLEVRLAGMNEDEFISTTFQPGWNPEIVKEVKKTSDYTNLKWGF